MKLSWKVDMQLHFYDGFQNYCEKLIYDNDCQQKFKFNVFIILLDLLTILDHLIFINFFNLIITIEWMLEYA